MAAIRYTALYTSLNGQDYQLDLYDTNFTGSATEISLGDGGCQISYDASGDKKFNPICASTMQWKFIVEDETARSWIESLITSIPEKTIYAYLTEMNFDTDPVLIWGGYLLLDLSSMPDESFPYEVSMRAVDGLALLKEQKWMKVGATGYTENDTYIADGRQNFIYWITEVLIKCDSHTVALGSVDYDFSTSVAWYNADMGAGSLLNDDPLKLTHVVMDTFYKLKDNGEYEPENTYKVLEAICTTWGMRVIYWEGRYHFIQVNEYLMNESGTFAAPDNINAKIYDLDGVSTSNLEYLGNTYFSRYQLPLNTTGLYANVGLQKLAESEYTFLPAIKNSIVQFEAIENVNYFTGYPDMFTEAEFATSNSSNSAIFNSKPIGTFTNAHNGAGWYLYLVMNLQGSVISQQWGTFMYMFTIRARQSGTTPWTYQLNKAGFGNGALSWGPWGSGIGWGNIGTGLMSGGVTCILNIFNPATYNQDTCIYDSGQSPNGKIPQPSWTASGDWEFEICTVAVAQNGSGYQNGFSPTYRGWGNQGLGWSNQNTPAQMGTPCAFAQSRATNTEIMTITYADSLGVSGPQGQVNFNTIFSPIMSAANNLGYSLISTYVQTTTTDTHTNTITGVKWGDTASPDSLGSIMVEDATTGILSFPDPTGLWDRGLAGGTKTMAEILAVQVIENQYHANPVLNGTIALSVVNKYNVDLSTSYIKQLCPLTRLVDRDSTPYILMRGKFNTMADEWEGEWWQVNNSTITTVVTTTGGGSDLPADTDDNYGLQGKIGQFAGGSQFVANDSKTKVAEIDGTITAGTTNSIAIKKILDIQGNDIALLKKGMKLTILNPTSEDRGALSISITLAADQAATDVALTIETIDVLYDISPTAPIYLDLADSYNTAIEGMSQEWTIRLEGTNLESYRSPTYILNGEDDTRSGRMGTINALAPTYINAQQSLKSGAFLCDADYTIVSARFVVSGTNNVGFTMLVYKTTPINGSNANTATYELASGSVTLLGDDKTVVKVLSLNEESSLELAAGDLIIPAVWVQEGEEGTSFRGSLSFTLAKRI